MSGVKTRPTWGEPGALGATAVGQGMSGVKPDPRGDGVTTDSWRVNSLQRAVSVGVG